MMMMTTMMILVPKQVKVQQEKLNDHERNVMIGNKSQKVEVNREIVVQGHVLLIIIEDVNLDLDHVKVIVHVH